MSCRCDGAALAAHRVCAPGQGYGLGHAGAPGEHQTLCGCAVRLPGLCTVFWVCLGVMCPLCVPKFIPRHSPGESITHKQECELQLMFVFHSGMVFILCRSHNGTQYHSPRIFTKQRAF